MHRIYLDYAASTPVDPRVLNAMKPYFSDKFGNPGALHWFGQEASAAVFNARRKIAEIIGADHRELIFTGSATEANNLALRGIIKGIRGGKKAEVQDPKIIVSAIEHESVLKTAQDLEKEGIEVFYVPVSKEGVVDLQKLKNALDERTVLVSVMYANNEVGTIQPIAEISNIIQEFKNSKREAGNKQTIKSIGRLAANHKQPDASAGSKVQQLSRFNSWNMPLFHTDAVQAFQYLDCDVNKLGVDLMTLSAHKIYGPKGIGALYVRGTKLKAQKTKQIPNVSGLEMRNSSLSLIKPIITGGGQESGLRSGTENVPAIVGFAKAAEIAAKIRQKEAKRVAMLRDELYKGIKKTYSQAEINGLMPPHRLANNLNVYLPNQPSADLLIKMDLAGIAVSPGAACSARATKPSHVLRAMKLSDKRCNESIRLSLGRNTTKSDISAVVKILSGILKPATQMPKHK